MCFSNSNHHLKPQLLSLYVHDLFFAVTENFHITQIESNIYFSIRSFTDNVLLLAFAFVGRFLHGFRSTQMKRVTAK